MLASSALCLLSWTRYGFVVHLLVVTPVEAVFPQTSARTSQGNLAKYQAYEGGKITERQAVQKMVQPCLTALADLHAKVIAHGAVLPQNILLNSQESTCKLAGVWLPSPPRSEPPQPGTAHSCDVLLQLYMLSWFLTCICLSFQHLC